MEYGAALGAGVAAVANLPGAAGKIELLSIPKSKVKECSLLSVRQLDVESEPT